MHREYPTYQFSGESTGGGWNPPPSLSVLTVPKKRGPERVTYNRFWTIISISTFYWSFCQKKSGKIWIIKVETTLILDESTNTLTFLIPSATLNIVNMQGFLYTLYLPVQYYSMSITLSPILCIAVPDEIESWPPIRK